jgi:L-ascorbate metabolism protein UlaG (beta-lactamase superfamily)
MVQPLVNQWYAWSHLIPPASSSMYVLNAHIKIMESFVSNPQAHVSALKNPAMISGPFIHYDASRVPEIKALLDRTKREQAHLLELAEGIRQLNQTLMTEAQGYSLEPLYERVPDVLKGYVELVYDVNNFPQIRFIEGLLYKSRFYDTSSQSIAISLIKSDKRPFIINTPRLKTNSDLHLDIPFADRRLDELFKMKHAPQPYGYIREILEVRDEDDELFSSFFAEEVSQPPVRYDDERIRLRYFGHACVLIESKHVSILCDPLISYEYPCSDHRYTAADLPEHIDYALITHYHQDHMMLEMLLQMRHKIKMLVVPKSSGLGLIDPSLKLILQNIGFQNVIEIDEMESIEINGGAITSIPFLGEHADLHVRAKTAYQIEIQDQRILCMADSNNIEPRLYEHIGASGKEVGALFIGMECDGAPLSWVYGPFMPKALARKMDQSRRLNGSDYEKAMKIVDCLNARRVYVYAMGQEPWLVFVMGLQYTDNSRPILESNKLVAACRERGLVSERLLGHKEIFL